MSINMFETRTMLEALQQMLPPKNFLRDTVFPKTENHTTRKVDIDIVKGSRSVAVYVSPLHEGKVVDKTGYETKTYEAPYSKEKMATTAQDVLTRQPGKTLYEGNGTPAQFAQQQLGKDLKVLTDRLDRLEEVQASEVIQTGILTVIGEGIPTAQIDFGMRSDHKPVLTSTDKWSDLTNSDPIADLVEWVNLTGQHSGIFPRRALFGAAVANDFSRNTTVQKLLDNRRVQMGEIKPAELPDNVKYMGHLDEPNLDIFVYTEWYFDMISEMEKPMINADKVVLIPGENSNARFVRHYGLIEDLKAGNFVGSRFPKSWETDDPSVRWVMVQSAPLTAPHQIDALLCAKVR